MRSCFERSSVARLLIVESVGLSEGVDEVRHELQGRFADAVGEEVRHAMAHDPFYADKDPRVFGRAVVGAVSDAVGYFLTHPGMEADSLAKSLCRIFAPYLPPPAGRVGVGVALNEDRSVSVGPRAPDLRPQPCRL